MPQRKLQVTEAYARNVEPLTELIYGGGDSCFARVPSLELPVPVTFRGKAHTHMSVERFQAGDFTLESNKTLIRFTPVLSLMLQQESGAETGLVTEIDYAPFGMSRRHLVGDSHMPRCEGILIPDAFGVVRGGRHFDESPSAEVLGGGEFGTEAEEGDLARLVARTIDATGELVRGIGYGVLAEMIVES